MTYEEMLTIWQQQGYTPDEGDMPEWEVAEVDEYGYPIEWLPFGEDDESYMEWLGRIKTLQDEYADYLSDAGDEPTVFDPDFDFV